MARGSQNPRVAHPLGGLLTGWEARIIAVSEKVRHEALEQKFYCSRAKLGARRVFCGLALWRVFQRRPRRL
jgi:hypothetical protein